ncbi:MAG TPA: hypothetical protein VIJ94_01470 [Caulobacteraceae bacterium]
MSTPSTSSRRSFLKVGALAAAPLAAAVPAIALAGQDHMARAQRLQDEAEIRALHQAWLRKTATGTDASALFVGPKAGRLDPAVGSVAADHAGEPDRIEVAADGQRANGRYASVVEIETELPRTTTLTQMAHAQGGGVVSHSERRLLKAEYVRTAGAWAIGALALERV